MPFVTPQMPKCVVTTKGSINLCHYFVADIFVLRRTCKDGGKMILCALEIPLQECPYGIHPSRDDTLHLTTSIYSLRARVSDKA